MKIGGVILILLGIVCTGFFGSLVSGSSDMSWAVLPGSIITLAGIVMLTIGCIMSKSPMEMSSQQKNKQATFCYAGSPSGFGYTCTIIYNNGVFTVACIYNPYDHIGEGGITLEVPKSLMLHFHKKEFQDWIRSRWNDFDACEPIAAEADVIAWVASLPINP